MQWYAVMKKCWKISPGDRPRFSELVATLDKTLQSVAGYMELSMTLVQPVTGGSGGEEEVEDWTGYEVMEPANGEEYEEMRRGSEEDGTI